MGNSLSSFICHEEEELRPVSSFSDINTDTYEGDFDIDGKRNGYGKLTFADGSYYHGQFKRNLFHGEGKYVTSGVTYDGCWINGQRSGNRYLSLIIIIIDNTNFR